MNRNAVSEGLTAGSTTDVSESARTLDTGDPFPDGLPFLGLLFGESCGEPGYIIIELSEELRNAILHTRFRFKSNSASSIAKINVKFTVGMNGIPIVLFFDLALPFAENLSSDKVPASEAGEPERRISEFCLCCRNVILTMVRIHDHSLLDPRICTHSTAPRRCEAHTCAEVRSVPIWRNLYLAPEDPEKPD